MTNTLELKIDLIGSYISDLGDGQDLDEHETRLHSVLKTYEALLLRDKHRSETDLEHLVDMRLAIQDCGELLHHLATEYPVQMEGWYHGIVPRNRAQAMANLVSRLILEFTRVLMAFRTKYPQLAPVCEHDLNHIH